MALELETFALTARRETWESLLRLAEEERQSTDEPSDTWTDPFWRQLESKLRRTEGWRATPN